MRSNVKEDLMQHSASVAILGQALGIIRNEFYGGNVDVDKIASLALYHDTAEVISGDLPTPIKYYNATMKDAYAEIEVMINNRLLNSMPTELQSVYSKYLTPDEETIEYKLMKVADKLSAFIKCIEERLLGSREFDVAYNRLLKVLNTTKQEYPELGYFLDNFIEGYGASLDIL